MQFQQLDPWAGQKSVSSLINQGIQNMFNPQVYQQQIEAAKLANAAQQATLPYAGPQAAAQLASEQQRAPYMQAQTASTYAGIPLTQAQTQHQQIMNRLPFGGTTLPGVAGQLQGLETVKMMYGENSPQFQQAKMMFDLQNQSTQSKIGYQNALAGSMDQRYLTPMGKSIVEQGNVQQGLMPSGKPYSPGAAPAPAPADQLAEQYGLLRQKQSSDAQARNRNLFATNIDKTIENINPQHLVGYSGLKGAAELAKDKAMAGLGQVSPKYENYMKSMVGADMLATQVRQFYGDSIQPSMIERLQRLTNPSTWANSPELAEKLYNQTVKILKQETGTYRQAVKSTKAYEEQPMQMPKFNNKQEFNQWYWSLPPQQREAVHSQLGGK